MAAASPVPDLKAALVDPAYEESIRQKVTREYLKVFPNLADKYSVYFCQSADGVQL